MKAMIINNGSQGSLDEVTATPADVRQGKISVDKEGEVFEGEIEDIEEATIGVVDWTGENTPSILFPGTAEPAHILLGKTAWVNSELIKGTIPIRHVSDIFLNAEEEYTIPAGYHDGTGKVTAASLRNQTPGTATPSYMLSNKTAWVNGRQITGLIPSAGGRTVTPTESTQTVYLNGKYMTGNITINPIPSNYTTTEDATATAAHILSGDTAYVRGSKITGTMPKYGAWPQTRTVGYDTTGKKVTMLLPVGGYVDSTAQYQGYFGAQAPYQDKTVTPSASSQVITSDTNTVLRQVTVNAIPGIKMFGTPKAPYGSFSLGNPSFYNNNYNFWLNLEEALQITGNYKALLFESYIFDRSSPNTRLASSYHMAYADFDNGKSKGGCILYSSRKHVQPNSIYIDGIYEIEVKVDFQNNSIYCSKVILSNEYISSAAESKYNILMGTTMIIGYIERS